MPELALSPRDRAFQAIEVLSVSPPGKWPHIKRQELCDQLSKRVDCPDLINQGGSPFCEPTSIVYGLARTDPLMYVCFVRDLFLYGRARLRQWLIAPRKSVLYAADFVTARVPVADWIPTVSIRNAEDWLFPIGLGLPSYVKNYAGVRLPQTRDDLKFKAGFTHVPMNLQRTVEGLEHANRWFHKEYIVCLGINAQLLEKAPSKLAKHLHHDGHRVVLESKIHIEKNFFSDDTIRLKVFSWGHKRGMHIPQRGPDGKQETLSVHDFLHNYHGFVAFKF
jgi:hypothetical protein